jgi:hypothetical protein
MSKGAGNNARNPLFSFHEYAASDGHNPAISYLHVPASGNPCTCTTTILQLYRLSLRRGENCLTVHSAVEPGSGIFCVGPVTG